MSSESSNSIIFIEDNIPPLEAGRYEISVSQTLKDTTPNRDPTNAPPTIADATFSFAVTTERFSFNPADIHSVFPQPLSTGEFANILPHVVFNRTTLPWERSISASSLTPDTQSPQATWLAILLFNEEETPPLIQKVLAQDLISFHTPINIYDDTGSLVPATDSKGKPILGTLPSNIVSYPTISQLDYGESFDTPCHVIDIPIETFHQICPSLEDLYYLAHSRKVDTTHSSDHTEKTQEYSIVIGNRVGKLGGNAHAFLVSLEHMASYLPTADKTSSFPSSIDHIRLICYRDWKFFSNTQQEEALKNLLENLNKMTPQGFSTTQYPFEGQVPTPSQITDALKNQASGSFQNNDPEVLVKHAFMMGYVPLPHELRNAGLTTSWYRGPLAPYPTTATLVNSSSIPAICSDALTQYNPQTGMLDVSYSAAWQLGQFLALQNQNFATALYNWKKGVQNSEAIAEESALIQSKVLGSTIFEAVFNQRTERLSVPALPETVVNWIAQLRLLNGVPFNYLIPDEKMLPPESIRFFYLDFNWINALVDGAFSIGRTSSLQANRDAQQINALHNASMERLKTLRKNPRPENVQVSIDPVETVSGFILRSQAVSEWPGLQATGYADMSSTSPSLIYKMERISEEILICFFEGNIVKVDIHEPPEQLHFGIEGTPGSFTKSLRAVVSNTYHGLQTGQLLTPVVGQDPSIPTKQDQQTLMVNKAAANFLQKLNQDYQQGLTNILTADQFALEMIKGVLQVEFTKSS